MEIKKLHIKAMNANTFADKINVVKSFEPSLALPYSLKDQVFLLDFTIELLQDKQYFNSIYDPILQRVVRTNISNLSSEVFLEASLVHENLSKLRIKVSFLEQQILELSNLLEIRFPQLVINKTKKIDSIIQKILTCSLINFLNNRRERLEKFKTDYPNIYTHFIEPLEMSVEYHSIPLYIFFCNPVRFAWFFALLNGESISQHAFDKLMHLEKSFKDLATVLDEQNYELLLQKIRTLLKASKENTLYAFAGESYNVFTEIDNLSEVISNRTDIEDKIVIPNEAGKIPDIRLLTKDGKVVWAIEVKGKMPGYGVDEENSLYFVNDFIIHFHGGLACIIRCLLPELDLFQHLPRLVFINPSPYGTELDIVSFIFKQLKVSDYSHRMKREDEKKLISDIISSLYDVPVLVVNGYRLGDDKQRFEKKVTLARKLYEKKFIKTTLQNCFEKFCEEEKRLKKLPPCTIRWYLALPFDLQVDIFSEEILKTHKMLKENIQNEIKQIFNEVMLSEFPNLVNKGITLEFRNL